MNDSIIDSAGLNLSTYSKRRVLPERTFQSAVTGLFMLLTLIRNGNPKS